MSEDKENEDTFNALVAKLVDNAATSEDIQVVLKLAKNNAEFKYALRAQLEMDGLSRLVFESIEETDHFVSEVLNNAKLEIQTVSFEQQVLTALIDNETHEQQSHRIIPTIKPLSWSVISIAATLVLALFLFWETEEQGTENIFVELQDRGVALVVNATGVHQSSRYSPGVSVSSGVLLLEKGILELEFYQGAQLKILGPAKIELISDEHVRLFYGKVMTEVPELAIGFTIDTPQSSLVDLGTSIGVEVGKSGGTEVHVFDGLLEARSLDGEHINLSEGQALKLNSADAETWQPMQAEQKGYRELTLLSDRVEQQLQDKHVRWQALRNHYISDSTLLAYYDFEPNIEKKRVLNNVADSTNIYAGAIVGAQWVQGPWPEKSALDFKRAGDRVRLNIDQTMTSFTLAAWVKIDSLDRTYNSLLLTDGFKSGDIHWQLGMFDTNKRWGTLVLGLKTTALQEIHFNHYPFFNSAEPGAWYHLTVTVDQAGKRVKMYVDGKQVLSSALAFDSQYWQIGQASIGNWHSQQRANPVRNLNGAMAELMIFTRVLPESEVARLALIENK